MTRRWGSDELPLYVRLQHKGKRRWIRVGILHVDQYPMRTGKGAPRNAEHIVTKERTVGASFEPDLLQTLRENGISLHRSSKDDFVFHLVAEHKTDWSGSLVSKGEWHKNEIPPPADSWFDDPK